MKHIRTIGRILAMSPWLLVIGGLMCAWSIAAGAVLLAADGNYLSKGIQDLVAGLAVGSIIYLAAGFRLRNRGLIRATKQFRKTVLSMKPTPVVYSNDASRLVLTRQRKGRFLHTDYLVRFNDAHIDEVVDALIRGEIAAFTVEMFEIRSGSPVLHTFDGGRIFGNREIEPFEPQGKRERLSGFFSRYHLFANGLGEATEADLHEVRYQLAASREVNTSTDGWPRQ